MTPTIMITLMSIITTTFDDGNDNDVDDYYDDDGESGVMYTAHGPVDKTSLLGRSSGTAHVTLDPPYIPPVDVT